MEDQKVVRRSVVKEDPYKKSQEELLMFVSKQIELMNSNLLFSGQTQPGIFELNQSLMNYESVMLGLIAIHAESRSSLDIEKEKFDNFYAIKYSQVKKEQAALGKSAQFTAQREIELYVRNTFMDEIAQYKASIIRAENEYNTINHLIDAWKSYQFILGRLSANSIAEAQAAGVALNNSKEFGDESINND